MTDVYVHVGLPKTGTTTIQGALDVSIDELAGAGVLYPGGREGQRLAAFDLVGQRIEGDERQVAGALARLVEEIDAHEGTSAVFSDEELGFARPRQAKRLVAGTVGPPRLHRGRRARHGPHTCLELAADRGDGQHAHLAGVRRWRARRRG